MDAHGFLSVEMTGLCEFQDLATRLVERLALLQGHGARHVVRMRGDRLTKPMKRL